jgi:broad specificity phosphatase PhoE
MNKIYLVRHGQAASGWGQETDPGLSDRGQTQARAAARKLAPLGPLAILSSPRARARETAAPLAKLWKTQPVIEEGLGEIRFPSETPADRITWLKEIMIDRWPNLDRDLQQWRRQVIEALVSIECDTVVFTHYIAINAAVGHAIGDERVVSFSPDNASITVMKTAGNQLCLVARGEEADTRVN